METDYSITGVQIQDVSGINAAFQPTASKRITFYVGKNGPFTVTLAASLYTPEAVLAAMDKEVQALKAIDAGISAQS